MKKKQGAKEKENERQPKMIREQKYIKKSINQIIILNLKRVPDISSQTKRQKLTNYTNYIISHIASQK